MKKILFILLSAILASVNCSNKDQLISSQLLNVNLGISFPPVADSEQRNFTTPLLKELNVNQIRIGENWSFREPIEGNFNWTPLDNRINWANDNNIEILLTIQSNGPDWACSDLQNDNSCVYNDNDKFKNYIEELLQRYPNKISKIQYGNEWQSDFWYVGNEQQFVAANNIVYDAIQQYSPETKFVLGGFTTISLRFLAGCNGLIAGFFDDEGNFYNQEFLDDNCDEDIFLSIKAKIDFILDQASYDILDIHLYDDVKNWDIYYNNLKSMTDKPIIVTEFGGPNINIEPDTEAYQANQLELYIKKLDSMRIEEAYFFKLVEGSNNPVHATSGLIKSDNLNKKQSYFKFKTLNNAE